MATANEDTRIARDFHDRTAHTPQSVRTSGHTLEWDIKPFPFKVYAELPALALPRAFEPVSADTLAALGASDRRRDARAPGGDRRAHGDLLAQHLEVPGARVAPPVLGLGHDAGEPARGGPRRGAGAAPAHRLRGRRREPAPRARRGPGSG